VELLVADGTPALRYEHLMVTDASGRRLNAEMGVSTRKVWLDVEDAGAIWPVTVDPTFSQQAYLKASNTGASDLFGISVAVSGDPVVVGASGEAHVRGVNGPAPPPRLGVAYVFVRSGAAWSQQAYLKASNTNPHDRFGWSVAVSSDTIVVGAKDEDSNATGVNGDQSDNSATASGAAYVFVRSGAAWSQQAYLKASNTGATDIFGWSVAVSGDTIVVGAVGEDSNATGVNGDQSNNSFGCRCRLCVLPPLQYSTSDHTSPRNPTAGNFGERAHRNSERRRRYVCLPRRHRGKRQSLQRRHTFGHLDQRGQRDSGGCCVGRRIRRQFHTSGDRQRWSIRGSYLGCNCPN
jgi:hypothetical protein